MKRVLIIGLLTVAAVVAWRRCTGTPTDEKPTSSGPAVGLPTAVGEPSSHRPPPAPQTEDGGTPEAGPSRSTESRSVETLDAVRHFEMLTRYPTSSRRLTRDSVDLLRPDKRYERRQPVPDRKANEDLSWEVLYTADRYFVRGDEPVTVSLTLWHDDQAVQPSRVAMVTRRSGIVSAEESIDIAVEQVGQGVSGTFVPEAHWPQHVGELSVTTIFAAEGLPEQTASLTLYFTAAARIPARFTGELADRLQEGNLVIDVGIDVVTGGRFRIEGNLYDDDEPFGWARFEGDLAPGNQSVPLVFYGLLFHDADATPPYTLEQIRGYRLRRGDSPHREDIPPYPGEYRTGSHYSLSDFRQDVYESPRKQRMLELYQDALDRGVELTNPSYTGSEALE